MGGKSRLLYNDGNNILLSTDGGCSWSTTYSLNPGTDAGGDNMRAVLGEDVTIMQLVGGVVTQGAASSADVYALIGDRDGYVTLVPDEAVGFPVFLATSHDGGATWQTSAISTTSAAGCSVEEQDALSRLAPGAN